MDTHALSTSLAKVADDIETTAIEIRRAGKAEDIRKSINDLVWLAGSLARIEEAWHE